MSRKQPPGAGIVIVTVWSSRTVRPKLKAERFSLLPILGGKQRLGVNHQSGLGGSEDLVESIISRQLGLQKIDAVRCDDKAATVVLLDVALCLQIPDREMKVLSGEVHQMLHVEER